MEPADPETIRTAISHREDRRLNHYGIDTRSAIYSHPTLARLRKQNVTTVQVKYHEHDLNHIEVFADGVWQCTATKSTVQPEHHRLGVLSVRAKQNREMKRLIAEADYQRVQDERDRLSEEGVPEAEWPVLPVIPADDGAEDDLSGIGALDLTGMTATIESAAAYEDSLGARLSGSTAADWLSRLSDLGDDDTAPTPTLPVLDPPEGPDGPDAGDAA